MTDYPRSMHAIAVEGPKGERLSWLQTELPTPSSEQVLVRVHATAVNRADLLQRRGLYPPPQGASPILGLEAAGVVIAVGDEVPNWRPGDRVCVLLEGGGYASHVACDASMLLPIPGELSFEEAAALPEAIYTAFLNLVIEGDLAPDERVLVHAGASGIGSMAIQIALARGHEVIATASAGKLDTLRRLGVALAVDRNATDRFDTIRASGDVDLIFDPVGGAAIADNLTLLRTRGRLVLIGLLGGTEATLPLGPLLRRRLRLIGSVLRSRSRAEKVAITERIRRECWPLVADGTLRPIVDRVLDIREAEAAHDLLRTNATTGKVVLRVPH